MKRTRHAFAIVVMLVMVFSAVLALVACKPKNTDAIKAAQDELDAYAATKLSENDYSTENRTAIMNAVTEGKEAIGAAEDSEAIKAALAEAKAKIDAIPGTAKQYTYHSTFSLSPSTWNPHQYKSTNDAVPYDYTTSGLWEFTYNEDYSGFEFMDVMAVGDPEDVSSVYAADAKWNIEADETGRAFRIHLNPDAKWDNGVAITADDYIYSMQQVLNQDLLNYRAGNYYTGSSAIVGAKGYYYSDRKTWCAANTPYSVYSEDLASKLIFTLGNIAEIKALNVTPAISIDLTTELRSSLAGSGLSDKHTAAQLRGFLKDGFGANIDADVVATMEGKTIAEIKANDAMSAQLDILTAWREEGNDGILDFCITYYEYPHVEWDDVGFKKIDDYTIDQIMEGSLAGFNIKYGIGNSFLVYKPLYESCKKQDPTTHAWSSSYGTSADTWVGYGPYKMTNYVADQIMEFERNEYWFGYSEKYASQYGTFEREIDGKTVKQYQATKIELRYAKEISTREQMFLKGEIVGLALNTELFKKYQSSRNMYFSEGATTYYGIIASDYDNLVEREAVLNGTTYDENYDGSVQKYNKTILTIKDFRKALALGLNRDELCSSLMPGTTPGTSLFSNLIVAAPDQGINLNDIPDVKAAICEYWGVTYGEGGEFATLDEAYDSITGYSPTLAKQLIDKAYDEAIEKKLLGPNTIVSLVYGAADDNETEQKWFAAFKTSFDNLFKGTKLEGKFEYKYDPTLGNTFGDAIRTGSVDTAWGFGWSGGELDPYGLFEVFVDSAFNADGYQYDAWVKWDKTDVTISLDVDGTGEKDITHNVVDWFYIINGMGEDLPDWSYGKISDDIRAKVLAAIEKEVLLNYTSIPFINQGGAQLKSYQINYGRETYNFMMGFGGIRFVTFNYSDAEWTAYIASQGGTLTY